MALYKFIPRTNSKRNLFKIVLNAFKPLRYFPQGFSYVSIMLIDGLNEIGYNKKYEAKPDGPILNCRERPVVVPWASTAHPYGGISSLLCALNKPLFKHNILTL